MTVPQEIATLLGVPLVGFADGESIHLRAYMTRRERQAFETRLRAVEAYSYTAGDTSAAGTATPVRLCGVLRATNVSAQVWEVRENYAADVEAIRAALVRGAA